MTWSGLAGILLSAAVMLGAFNAHGLRGRLDACSMSLYERAVSYHFVHALGLLVVPVLARVGVLPASAMTWVAGLLVAGIVLFSGSLYLLATTGVRLFGAVTPVGGVAFLAAWLVRACAVVRS